VALRTTAKTSASSKAGAKRRFPSTRAATCRPKGVRSRYSAAAEASRTRGPPFLPGLLQKLGGGKAQVHRGPLGQTLPPLGLVQGPFQGLQDELAQAEAPGPGLAYQAGLEVLGHLLHRRVLMA
jgi:hypothetical protein